MADIWLPGWRRHLYPLRGKPYQFTHNPKGCLHTTEGGSIAGALSAYAPYPPHCIYDWRSREKVQHIPLNWAAYSAMDGNDDDYMVQVELVGFAAESRNWPEQALRNIAEDVIGPIEEAFGVPRKAIWHGFKDGRDGISPPLATTGSPIRLSPAQLRDFSGWLGHQHLPSPDTHWDPGAIPINRIFGFMQEGEVTAQELWSHPIDKDPSPGDAREEVPAGEMLKYTNQAAWAAADGVQELLERPVGQVTLSPEDRAAIVADLKAELVEEFRDIVVDGVKKGVGQMHAVFAQRPNEGV